jgi:hypothetical protein
MAPLHFADVLIYPVMLNPTAQFIPRVVSDELCSVAGDRDHAEARDRTRATRDESRRRAPARGLDD